MHPSLQSTFVVIASCNTTYQGTLVAIFFAASQGLLLSRLIVARAIPIASRAFATVAIQRLVGGAAVVATAIVVDTTTIMAPISAVDNVVASIVAKSNLASGALAAPAVGGLAEPPAELLRSFAKETFADRICLLAFDCTVELFSSHDSLIVITFYDMTQKIRFLQSLLALRRVKILLVIAFLANDNKIVC